LADGCHLGVTRVDGLAATDSTPESSRFLANSDVAVAVDEPDLGLRHDFPPWTQLSLVSTSVEVYGQIYPDETYWVQSIPPELEEMHRGRVSRPRRRTRGDQGH